ncbi:nucleotidyltransferase family protein [Brumicola pallidula]|uniref:Molybdenum cofactor cytidylyltransferase n=1 Tax=Brumicola pallidula DSM 14239 = ACAM 615 TaxID=1121922 RepID=K7A5N4_9ALTE|nr:nucleotidyltransferase family protein [Glaciecola pallidula]GAC30780.1 molybdenum cofactor cytidylyltransferase [Glaciecola pallidula DSM 14239 = ACAM 615]
MNTEEKYYSIEAILLAAGESSRFNDTKQLAFVDKKPMLVGTVEMLKQVNFNSITVVLGANASNIENVLQQVNLEPGLESITLPSVTSIIAHKWQQGMGASIAAGVTNLAQEITHVFIGLTDQVEVRSEQCSLMVIESRKNPNKIVAAFYNGKLGAPAIFPKAYFAELALLENDKGARNILRANATTIISIDMPEAARDIDTKKDLLSYESNTQT